MAIPEEDVAKAKEILLGIIEGSGGAFIGKTRIFKTFYIAHLYHFEKRDGVLSDYPIVRMPKGPGIDQADKLFRAMADEGLIRLGTRPAGPFTEWVCSIGNSTRKAVLTDDERESIREAVEWTGDDSAGLASFRSHEQSQTWHETPNGQIMNIYADILEDEEYQEMKRRLGDIREKLYAAQERRQSRMANQEIADLPQTSK